MGVRVTKELGFERTQMLQNRLAKLLIKHQGPVQDDLSLILDPAQYGEALYLSGIKAGESAAALNAAGITRVLNVTCFDTEEKLRKDGYTGELLILNVSDNEDFPIDSYFEEAWAFLRKPWAGEGGPAEKPRQLVHCQLGISRSSTFVIAYLMKFYNMNLWQAAEITVKGRGIVYPNEGFLEALVLYAFKNNKL